MAAAEIQVVNPANLAKIESFLNDSSYKEIIESSSTFNSRICAERRMRLPFIDTQTGVAQSNCNLFMSRKQRMPGLKEGQVYTYPAQRWRKSRRQYLTAVTTRWGWSGIPDHLNETMGDGENSSGILGESGGGEDSRDGSQTATNKDDPKEWFYDELAMEEMETGEEPDPESDEDYFDDTYANRRRRRGVPLTGPGSRGGKVRGRVAPDDTPGKRGRGGRGRKRAGQGTLPYEVPGDAEKPYGCELCGAKYKTRAGLTYHFTHTHKETSTASDGESSRGGANTPTSAALQPATEYQDSYVTFINKTPLATSSVAAAAAAAATAAAPPAAPPSAPPPPPPLPSPPPRPHSADTSSSESTAGPLVPPTTAQGAGGVEGGSEKGTSNDTGDEKSRSPYCDFCLGDDRENKKTGTAEELVSCSDCGRSGHPTCLQFTANMIVSVRKYRWQCIECKCCSVCGNSDNDDQLLFCDDCDRGYHMYCLTPPLHTPPEGSWSCALCIKEFHTK